MRDAVTVTCQNDREGFCGCEREVSITANYSPAERMTRDYPGAPASWEVYAECDEACPECGHRFTEAELQQIADAYEPEVPDKADYRDYEPDDR